MYDQKFLIEESVHIAVQINGKLRDAIIVPTNQTGDKEQVEMLARASTKVAGFLAGKSIQNVIYVPGRLINFVML